MKEIEISMSLAKLASEAREEIDKVRASGP